MKRGKIFWQVYIPNVVIVLLALIATSVYSYHSVKVFNRDQLAMDLHFRAILASELAFDENGLKPESEINALCVEYGRKIATRITVILPDGRVIGDSDRDPAAVENHADRPEIIEAIKGDISQSTRYSTTVRKNMMYFAMPLRHQGRIAGVMRVALPLTSVQKALGEVSGRIALSFMVVVLASLLAGLLVSRNISRPLRKMKQSIMQYRAGGSAVRVEVPDSEEMAAVAEAFNSMVTELDKRMTELDRQDSEQRAVLASMQECVLAVDNNERILQMNGAFLELIGAGIDRVKGRSIQETVRNVDLQNFSARALESRQSVEGDIVMQIGQDRRFFQAHGTALYDAAGERMGALIVLNDFTRIRKLEAMRRDFVANVSHELKTPITSIKGFVETLKDDPDISKDKYNEFLEIIFRQTNRLNAIIDDILVLSRLEFEAEDKSIELLPSKIAGILKNAVEVCEERARNRNISISVTCQEGIRGNVNSRLLEQAISNLLDNAVKYSEEGRSIRLDGSVTARGLEISVIDQGFGMKQSDKERIFERFYRIDKARSRDLGGTGLGLAIVKHIVIAHRGTIEVDTEPGRGSTFKIILPQSA